MLFSQVRARMQLSDSGGLCSRGGASIRSPLHAMELVVRKEGAVALWRSLPEAVVYNAVLNSTRIHFCAAAAAAAAVFLRSYHGQQGPTHTRLHVLT